MTRRSGVITFGLIAVLLLTGTAFAQPGRGPISGGSGGGGGVSGLTACDGGVAISDNVMLLGDGTEGCQGSSVTVDPVTGDMTFEGTTADGFEGAFTFTDGSNLKLAGDFTTTADDTISLCYDGTNWYETGRSVN